MYSLIPQLCKGLPFSNFLWSDVISFITLYITDFVQKAPVFLSQLQFHLLEGKDHTLDSWPQAVTGIVLDLLYRLIGGPLDLSSKCCCCLLLSRFSRVWLCATPETAAHQAPLSLGFSRQEHWSGLPFPFPMDESEKWKWSRSVMSDS